MNPKKMLPLAAALVLLSMAARANAQSPRPINLSAAGVPLSPGVRGQALPSVNKYRTNGINGNQMGLEVSRGTSIRGVAGGLEADIYDWRTRNNDQRTTTLDYLRYARDYDANLVITANVRGLVEPDPAAPGFRRFYDTSIETLTETAAQWVRYTNVIAQTYREGDAIADPADQAILDSLVWSTGADDMNAKLPSPGEPALPKVEYWEIGNEPRVGVTNAYKVTNGFTFLTPNHPVDDTHRYDFRERYASMTAAMKAVDPTIKVGPTLQTASSNSEKELLNSILNQQSDGSYLPIDFIGYHPYQKISNTATASAIESGLRSVYSEHYADVNNLRRMIALSGRDADDVEFIASEINVSNWNTNDTAVEAQMAHALGSVETVFSLGRLGVKDAHYWLWPADPWDRTEYPVYKAYEALQDHMGDILLSTYGRGNLRLYATRDSASGQIALWGLNFSNSLDSQLQLSLTGLAEQGYEVEQMTLQALNGPTTLFSGNLASYMPGGPTRDVDWVATTPLDVDLSSYVMSLPASTISLLVLTPNAIPEPTAWSLALLAAAGCAARRRRTGGMLSSS